MTQSLAIIEYLDEVLPEPALLPGDPLARARVRSLAQMIAMDVHPINNLRVLGYLKEQFGADDEAITRWFRHWVREAFGAFEKALGDGEADGSLLPRQRCDAGLPCRSAYEQTGGFRFHSTIIRRSHELERPSQLCQPSLPQHQKASPTMNNGRLT